MQNNFFGSKLNTVLLFILILLVLWAISLMLKNKEVYLPNLVLNSGEKTFTGIITDENHGCWSDGQCALEINNKYWVETGRGWYNGPIGQREGELKIGAKVEIFAQKSDNNSKSFSILGDDRYYIKVIE
jgi:hypothetical protein